MTAAQQFLDGLDLKSPTKVKAKEPAKESTGETLEERASKVVFDDVLVAQFDLNDREQFTEASRALFKVYKQHKQPDWNSLIHRRISEHLGTLRRKAATGGFVKEKVKTTRGERDMAAMLAAHDIDAQDLVEILRREQMLADAGITTDQLAAIIKENK